MIINWTNRLYNKELCIILSDYLKNRKFFCEDTICVLRDKNLILKYLDYILVITDIRPLSIVLG